MEKIARVFNYFVTAKYPSKIRNQLSFLIEKHKTNNL